MRALHITALALAALLALACSDDGDGSATDTAALTPLVLSTTVSPSRQTRAADGLVETETFAPGAPIGLYAGSTQGLLQLMQGNNGTELAPANLANATITADATTATWLTNRYWPADAVTLQAYYPQGGAGIAPTVLEGSVVPQTIGFTMQTDTKNQVDLLVSDRVTATLVRTPTQLWPTDGVVELTFAHQLAQLRFYVLLNIDYDGAWQKVYEDGNINVTVALSGLYGQGTLTLGATAEGHTWGGLDGSVTSTAADASWTKVDDTTLASFNPDDYTITQAEKMLVLPTTYGTGAIPKMTVTISDTGGDVPAVSYSTTVENHDSDTDDTPDQALWQPGYIYNYYFVLEIGKTIWGYFLDPTLRSEQW